MPTRVKIIIKLPAAPLSKTSNPHPTDLVLFSSFCSIAILQIFTYLIIRIPRSLALGSLLFLLQEELDSKPDMEFYDLGLPSNDGNWR